MRVEIKLVSGNACRRYQLMRELALDEAKRAGGHIKLAEETDAESILKYLTVHIPMLFIRDERIAQSNLKKLAADDSRGRVGMYGGWLDRRHDEKRLGHSVER